MPPRASTGPHQIVAAMLVRADTVLLCHRTVERGGIRTSGTFPVATSRRASRRRMPSSVSSERRWVSRSSNHSAITRSHGRPRSSSYVSGPLADGPALRRTVRPRSTMRSAGSPPRTPLPCVSPTPAIAAGSSRPCRMRDQRATIVAASAIRWSFDHGAPNLARGPCSTSSARGPRMPAASASTSLAS